MAGWRLLGRKCGGRAGGGKLLVHGGWRQRVEEEPKRGEGAGDKNSPSRSRPLWPASSGQAPERAVHVARSAPKLHSPMLELT